MARWQAADIKRRLRGHRTGKTSQTVGHGSLVTWAVTTDMSHKSSRNHVGEHPTHQAHNHSAIVTAKRPFRASCKPDNVLRQAPEGAGGRSDARSGTGGRRRSVRRSPPVEFRPGRTLATVWQDPVRPARVCWCKQSRDDAHSWWVSVRTARLYHMTPGSHPGQKLVHDGAAAVVVRLMFICEKQVHIMTRPRLAMLMSAKTDAYGISPAGRQRASQQRHKLSGLLRAWVHLQ